MRSDQPRCRTLSLQMWTNLRYTITPTILSVASLVLLVDVLLLPGLEVSRRRNAAVRGILRPEW